jgi:glutaredoxin-like protein NrdH
MAYEKFIKEVPGKKKNDILLFTLSTCGWCQKTKKLLDELGVEYSYVDVDLLDAAAQDEATKELAKWNPMCSFPTMVIDKNNCIIGFQENKIKETLGSGK